MPKAITIYDLDDGNYVVRPTPGSRWRGVLTIDRSRHHQILVDDSEIGGSSINPVSEDGFLRAVIHCVLRGHKVTPRTGSAGRGPHPVYTLGDGVTVSRVLGSVDGYGYQIARVIFG